VSNKPTVSIEYLPVADNALVTGNASALTQAGKLVALDSEGKINRYFIPYNEVFVTSISTEDGEALTGDIGIYGSGTISVTRSGSNFFVSPNFSTGLTGISVNGSSLSGEIVFLPGNGIEIAANSSDRTITFSNRGVISLNGLREEISLQSSNGIVIENVDNSTLSIGLSSLSWSIFDSSSPAKASKIVVSGGMFLGDSPYANIYNYQNKTIIRGVSGVSFLDPLQVDTLTISGGNGLILGQSSVRDISGSLTISPASGSIVLSTGSHILGIGAIQPSFQSEGVTQGSSSPYSVTFSHSKGLLPATLLVTKVEGSLETTLGYGANVVEGEDGYFVNVDENSITVLSSESGQTFRARCIFSSNRTAPDSPSYSLITSAPVKPTVTLIGEPNGGGYVGNNSSSDILVSTRPVANASTYKWFREADNYTWETDVPLISHSTVDNFVVKKPGIFKHYVWAENGISSGARIDFDIKIRPAVPILESSVLNIRPMGPLDSRKKADILVTHQAGLVDIVRLYEGSYLPVTVENPISYDEPDSSVSGEYSEIVQTTLTLTNLLPNSTYELYGFSYLSGNLVYSDYSDPLVVVIP